MQYHSSSLLVSLLPLISLISALPGPIAVNTFDNNAETLQPQPTKPGVFEPHIPGSAAPASTVQTFDNTAHTFQPQPTGTIDYGPQISDYPEVAASFSTLTSHSHHSPASIPTTAAWPKPSTHSGIAGLNVPSLASGASSFITKAGSEILPHSNNGTLLPRAPAKTASTSSSSTTTKASSSASTASAPNPSASGGPRKYVHFECGTNVSHASDHLFDTIHGLHHGTFPNGTSYDGPASNGTFGGTYDPHSANGIGKKLARLVRRIARRQTNTATAASASNPATVGGSGPIAVKVYIHVVTTKAHAGMVTQPQVNAQVSMLNSAYNSHGVSFKLANSDFTVNDAWAVGGSDATDVAMKTALRQGSYADLNLYFQSDMAGGVLGQCTLPTNIGTNAAPSVYVRDGCNIAAGTVPSGPINGYNMGKTAVHETGHWLGLLHTFEGYSCSGNGDFVADTPSEAQSTDGCPVSPWKNTCPGRAGADPIHNYMDYSTDACYSRFTMGQEGRVHSLWPQYRAGK